MTSFGKPRDLEIVCSKWPALYNLSNFFFHENSQGSTQKKFQLLQVANLVLKLLINKLNVVRKETEHKSNMREINLNMTKALYTPAQEKRGNLSFNK